MVTRRWDELSWVFAHVASIQRFVDRDIILRAASDADA